MTLLIAVTAALACGQSTPVTLVQHRNTDSGTTTSSSLSFTANNTAGRFIAVVIRAGASSDVFTVTDTLGNTYRSAVQLNVTVDPPAGDTLAVFYAENINAGANTVTVAGTIPATLRFAILEYSGVVASGSIDGAVASEGTDASPNTGNLTTTGNGDLVLVGISSSDDRTFTAGNGYTILDQVPSPPNTKLATEHLIQPAAGAVSGTATLNSSANWGAVLAAFRTAPPIPDLTLSKTHPGKFTQSQTGATYTLTAINVGGASTSGTVTVTDTLPSGLTATAISGTGWTCTLETLTCSRADALAGNSSYPVITITVNVAGDAPATVTNTAVISGGADTNASNNTANDITTIRSYAAVVGQWSAVMSWPIVAVHAHLLPNGDVLAWSDDTANIPAQIWRPSTATFTIMNINQVNLFCAGHSYMADGRLMIAGGTLTTDDVGPPQTTLFNPSTSSWSAGGLMSMGRYYPTTTTLADGRVLVQGGTTTCNSCVADRPEIYDPATNRWTQMASSATMSFKYYPHSYVLPDGRVIVAAQNDKAISTRILDLNTQAWTTLDARILDGHSSVMYQPGKIMKAGTAAADNPGLPAAATTLSST